MNDNKTWLEKLQEQSWELEFLISGGAIFSLLELSQYFLDLVFTLKITFALTGTSIFIIVGMFGIKLLTVGFATHLILRAYWVGLISLHNLFPNGIKVQRDSTNTTQLDNFTYNNLEKQITSLNKFASIAMFLSIASTLVIAGLICCIILTITLPIKILPHNLFSIYNIFISIVFAIYLIDIFTFNLLRKIKIISYLLFPVFWLFDKLSFRFVYSKALKVYYSNLTIKKSILIFLPFLFTSLLITYNSVYKVMNWPNLLDEREYRNKLASKDKILRYVHYLDMVKESGKKISTIAIQSQIITGSFLKVYIPYQKHHDFLIKSTDNQNLENNISILESVSINDSIIQNIDWFNYQTFDNDQIGLITIMDISSLSKGKHLLKIIDKNNKEIIIPFWKEDEK
jgi:hypothetical protein